MAGRDGAGWTAEPVGERMLLLRLGAAIDPALNARVHALAGSLQAAGLTGITDLVPAYASLAVHYDPLAWDEGDGPPWRRLERALRAVQARAAEVAPTPRRIELPVRYGGDEGPDLETVARHAGIAPDEVVLRHAAATYRVAMLGFAPGFPYLLGLDPVLELPRRAEPRLRVPAGSVAIGGAQTGVYPRELPGGWHLVGRTPLVLFDPGRDPPCLLAPGDEVRFRPLPR